MQQNMCTRLLYMTRTYRCTTLGHLNVHNLGYVHQNVCNAARPSRLLLPRQASVTQVATLFKEPPKPSFDPVKGELVYVGTVANMVKNVKLFSLSTSILGISFQPMLYTKAVASQLPVWLKFFMSGFMNVFIFAVPAMLHFITKRYVTHLYYNSETEKYTAINYTFFVNDKETTFEQKQVTVPEVPGVFTTIKVDGRPLFVDPSMFLDKDVFVKLMSYDKPMDWDFDDKILKGMKKEEITNSDKKV